jgi:hypothetical protein
VLTTVLSVSPTLNSSIMMKRLIILICLAFGLTAMLKAQSLERAVLSSLGAYMTGTQVNLSTTVGQAAHQTLSGTLTLTQGFQQPDEAGSVGLEKELPFALDYRVYPNPTAGPLRIELHSDRALTVRLQIWDLQGRAVSVPVETMALFPGGWNEVRMDLGQQTAGHYLLMLTDGKGQKLGSFTLTKY